MNDKAKAWVEKTPAENINVGFAYDEDTQELILTKDGVINRIDVSTLISHNEKDDTKIIFISQNATNGDVLKKMFPTAKFYCAERLQTAGMPRRNADFDVDWWNAPYKAESED